MALWWIAVVLFVAVIIPVVIALLNRVMRPAVEIKRYADDLAEHATSLPPQLDRLPELGRTRELLGEVAAGLERYGRALDDLLEERR